MPKLDDNAQTWIEWQRTQPAPKPKDIGPNPKDVKREDRRK